METETVSIENPEGLNFIIGQTHFIKSVEDLYEALVDSAPDIKFGLAFCEASGPCLIRYEGNDEALKQLAVRNAQKIGAGHTFIIFMKKAFPVNLLPRIRSVPEVCSIFAASSNQLDVVIASTEKGRGILGVIDGEKPKGVETERDVRERKEFLRKIGYKL